MSMIKKIFNFLSGNPCYKKPKKPIKAVEHYAVYQYTDPSTMTYQIKYGWHKRTAQVMKIGDYARLPEAQAFGLYQGIVALHGEKSAKTRAIKDNLRKVTRIK
jgi:hypothetical protein|tara:strand:- start:123 stop:431 length:309 start_codon:yes stop_codon:yes gene_type:complete